MDKNPLHLLLHKRAGEVHTSKLVMKDLVILSVFFINLEDVTFLGHFIAGKIFIISCDFINQFAVRKNFHNTVCGCLYKLMIMRCEKDYTRKFDQSVVKCSNGFHIQMVGRLIQEIIILERRQRTFSPPERTRTRFTPSSPGKSIRPRNPRT